MSNMSETVADYVLDNDNILWSTGKIDIAIPSDVKTVFLDFYPGGALQTSGDIAVLMRVNGDTAASYINAVKYHNGVAYQTSLGVGYGTSMRVFLANGNDPQAGCSQVVFHTRNGSKGNNAMPYGQVTYQAYETAGYFPVETRLISYSDNVNTVSTLNIFTLTDGPISCRMKVRFSR